MNNTKALSHTVVTHLSAILLPPLLNSSISKNILQPSSWVIQIAGPAAQCPSSASSTMTYNHGRKHLLLEDLHSATIDATTGKHASIQGLDLVKCRRSDDSISKRPIVTIRVTSANTISASHDKHVSIQVFDLVKCMQSDGSISKRTVVTLRAPSANTISASRDKHPIPSHTSQIRRHDTTVMIATARLRLAKRNEETKTMPEPTQKPRPSTLFRPQCPINEMIPPSNKSQALGSESTSLRKMLQRPGAVNFARSTKLLI